MDKESTVIEYHSAEKLPEEYADYPSDINPIYDGPLQSQWKTHKVDYRNLQLGNAYKKSFRNYRRFKEHRHDAKNKRSGAQ